MDYPCHTKYIYIIYNFVAAQAQSCYKKQHQVAAVPWLQGPALHREQLELLFVQLWAQIHSPCQTLLGSAIFHLWSLNNLLTQVPGNTGSALPIYAPRIGSGLLASHSSPLGMLDLSRLHAGLGSPWVPQRFGEIINSAPKMQKHLIWLKCGPSQLKWHKTLVRRRDTKREARTWWGHM